MNAENCHFKNVQNCSCLWRVVHVYCIIPQGFHFGLISSSICPSSYVLDNVQSAPQARDLIVRDFRQGKSKYFRLRYSVFEAEVLKPCIKPYVKYLFLPCLKSIPLRSWRRTSGRLG